MSDSPQQKRGVSFSEKAPKDQSSDDGPKSALRMAGHSKRAKSVYCSHCKTEIPADEWPNHRAGLRNVELKRRTMTFVQRYLLNPTLNFIMWVLANVFFREVCVVGSENVPKDGPVVFYGNHQNQFMDAVMMRAHCDRAVRFIIAEKSMHRPIIGTFAKLMEAVPVVRPQDVPSTPGQGKLVKVEGDIVTGDETEFQKGLETGDVLTWTVPTKKERCTGQVVEIISATSLKLSTPVAQTDVVSTPTSFKISRRIDHSEMYADVYGTLGKGQCLGIFPEGGSHDRTSLQPLKAGVALFTLGAAERGIFPKIIPVGLTYFYGHKFRSKAHIEFGKPLTAPDDLVELFTKEKRVATGKMLDLLGDALRQVTINVPDWETLKFLHSFRRLYQPPQMMLETGDYLRLTRRLSLIIAQQEEDPDFADFRQHVENYGDFCNALLVRDAQAATLSHLKDDHLSFLLFRRLVILCVLATILIPLIVVCGPIGAIVHFWSEYKAKVALSESKVKVVGADVKASYKIVLGFVLVPLTFFAWSSVVYAYTDFRTGLTVYMCLPMAMYVSLVIVREFVMEGRAALPLLMSILSKHKQFVKLHERRTKLVAQARELVARFDPDLEDELRIYQEESSITRGRVSLFSLRHRSSIGSKKAR